MEKFMKGVKAIESNIKTHITNLNSQLNYFFTNRIAIIVFYNSWFIFGVIDPFADIISIICFISILVLSYYIYKYDKNYNVKQMNYTTRNLIYNVNSIFEWAEIEDDENEKNTWCKKYNPIDKELLNKSIDSDNVNKELEKINEKLNFKIKITTIVFVIAILNKSIESIHKLYLNENDDIFPTWIIDCVNYFQN